MIKPLTVEAKALVHEYLVDLVESDRLSEIVKSRDALVEHYRSTEQDSAAADILSEVLDFSLSKHGDALIQLLTASAEHERWKVEDLQKEAQDRTHANDEEARKIAAERNYYFQFSRWEDMPDDLKMKLQKEATDSAKTERWLNRQPHR